jgi:hypothetical protein
VRSCPCSPGNSCTWKSFSRIRIECGAVWGVGLLGTLFASDKYSSFLEGGKDGREWNGMEWHYMTAGEGRGAC